ncbi:MAG: hemolysin family protein [Lachnospiraceae bacterium]|nr:hemolysin family protein [Lachnospiraceae bacterium]
MSTTTSILVMTVLVIFSAFFSATETAFSAMNRARMKTLAEDGNKRAALVMALSEKYDSLLSTILVLNNLVNISLSAIATVFFIGLLEKNGATVATAVVTVVVLIFGEVTPKSLAKQSPDRFTMVVAPVIRVFMIVLTPVNLFFAGINKLTQKFFRVKEEPPISEDELLTLVDEAEQDGGIEAEESELIRSAIEFNDLKAIDIYTPRVNIVGIEENDGSEEIEKTFRESGYSRLPVYRETVDEIVGVLHEKDFYELLRSGKGTIGDYLTPPVFITLSSKVGDTLRLLQKNKAHMAVIADEFGGTVGIVTMEDILEELVGEIYDEHDEVDEKIHMESVGVYKVDCSADLDDLFELFELDPDEDEELESVSTVGGWVMQMAEAIPEEGSVFVYKNLSVRVTSVDPPRVLEVEITVLPPEEEEKDEKSEKAEREHAD